MPIIPFYAAGDIGIIKDIPADELDPRAWSDGRGTRFYDGKACRALGAVAVFGTPLGGPYWLMPVQAGALALWVYASLIKLYATDGATHTEVTRAAGGDYTMDKKMLWNGGTLSQIPIITNGFDVPQFWAAPGMGTDFANLTAWPAGDRCQIIKPFKNFVVAMAVTRGGVLFKHLVKWSHPAVPGSVPSSWDETDPTLQAGEVEILDELPGGIRDGLGMRDTFIIYKDNSMWGMQFVGGNSVFRFFPILLQAGIMSTHCAAAVMNGSAHFVATGDDFIIHDGQNARSVFTRKIKRFILNTLPSTLLDYCYCIAKPGTSEVWFNFPEAGGEYPTLSAVYNWIDETCTIRSFGAPNSFMDIGPSAATSDPWDADPLTWDSDTTTWDQAFFSPHVQQLIASRPGSPLFAAIEDPISLAQPGYIERTGLALIGQDRVTGQLKADNEVMKLCDRIWIKATGAAFNVQLGAQEFSNSPVVYQPQQLFTPGVDKYLDFIPVNGRFLAVRMDWAGTGITEIAGYDLNVTVLGQQ